MILLMWGGPFGGWRLQEQKRRQYTLSFNSMHRITRGPSGEVSDVSALSLPALLAPPPAEQRRAARRGAPGWGEHRAPPRLKGPTGGCVCAGRRRHVYPANYHHHHQLLQDFNSENRTVWYGSSFLPFTKKNNKENLALLEHLIFFNVHIFSQKKLR